MKAREILPYAAMGGLLAVIILLIVESYAAVALGANAATDATGSVGITVVVMGALAFTVGGFAAAFLATRRAKDTLDRAMASSAVSALLATLAIGAFTLISTGLQGVAQATMMLLVLGFAGVAASALGGLILTLMMGVGDSEIAKALGRLWKAYRTAPSAIVPPLAFTLLLLGLTASSDYVLGMAGEWGLAALVLIGLAAAALLSFGITSVVLAVEKRRPLRLLLVESIHRSKPVFAALVATMVPIMVGGAALGYTMLDTGLLSLLFPVIAVLMLAYVFLLEAAPQALLLGKKNVRQCFGESFRFVSARWMQVLGLLATVVVAMVLIELALVGVDFAAFTAGFDSSAITGWLTGTLNLVLMTGALSGLWLGGKK